MLVHVVDACQFAIAVMQIQVQLASHVVAHALPEPMVIHARTVELHKVRLVRMVKQLVVLAIVQQGFLVTLALALSSHMQRQQALAN